jgi:hypothetical protein
MIAPRTCSRHLVLILTAASAYAAASETETAALRGEGPVGVAAAVAQEPEGSLRTSDVQTIVELRFRAAGIEPLPISASAGVDLYVDVEVFGESTCAFVIRAYARQPATLRTGMHLNPIVWNDLTYGTVGCARTEQLKDSVATQVDEFLNDYLKANPRGDYAAERRRVVPSARQRTRSVQAAGVEGDR